MFAHFALLPLPLIQQAAKVRLFITDCDGVLTDTGVFVGPQGELMKRFSIRDGMGVERLRELVGVSCGIMTGEHSESVSRRAEKLQLPHLFLGAKDKDLLLNDLLQKEGLLPESLAYIGDDTNDLKAIQLAGFSACPADAMPIIQEMADYTCQNKGGQGAFREVAELIIYAKHHIKKNL